MRTQQYSLIPCRHVRAGLCIALAALVLPVFAQGQGGDAAKEVRGRAVERCLANRGVDCTTDQGLEEWIVLERGPDERRVIRAPATPGSAVGSGTIRGSGVTPDGVAKGVKGSTTNPGGGSTGKPASAAR